MRGPHVEKRRWKDAKTGEPRESRFWFLVFYRGGRRVFRRTEPATESKRIALDQLHRAVGGDERSQAGATAARVFDTYARHLEANSPSSMKSRGYWILWWRARWLGRSAAGITRSDVDSAVLALKAAGREPGTLGGYLSLLRAAWRRGVEEGLVDADHPLCSLRVAYSSPERHVTWTDDELVRVMRELPVWGRHLVALLRTTGLRLGDALALTWENVHETHLRFHSEKPDRGVTKALSPEVSALLAAIPRVAPWLFPNDGLGGPRTKSTFGRLWAPALKRAGVAGKTVHDIRRTWATAAYNAGVSNALIAEGLGQRSTRLVPLYTHSELATRRDAEVRAGGNAAVLAAVGVALGPPHPAGSSANPLQAGQVDAAATRKRKGR